MSALEKAQHHSQTCVSSHKKVTRREKSAYLETRYLLPWRLRSRPSAHAVRESRGVDQLLSVAKGAMLQVDDSRALPYPDLASISRRSEVLPARGEDDRPDGLGVRLERLERRPVRLRVVREKEDRIVVRGRGEDLRSMVKKVVTVSTDAGTGGDQRDRERNGPPHAGARRDASRLACAPSAQRDTQSPRRLALDDKCERRRAGASFSF